MNQQFVNQVEALYSLQMCQDFIPGFSKAYAFFYHPIYKEVRATAASKNSNSLKEINTNDIFEGINQLRNKGFETEWVDEKNIPFQHISSSSNFQKEVFDEFKHYILLLRFKNKWDNNYDLLYIFFKPNASNFGLKKFENNLNTEHKSIIASFIQRSFKVSNNQHRSFEAMNNELRNDNKALGSQLKKHRLEKEINNTKFKTRIENFILNSLKKEAAKLNLNIQLTQEAHEYIQQYEGELETINEAAKNSIAMAYRVQNVYEGGILKIEDYFLQPYFSIEKSTSVNIGIEAIEDSRYIKTIQMLNKLENAANKVQSNGRSLSGSNLGQAMSTPISAPAISDALKKHKSKIQSLCNKYPDEWTLIRKAFRPVINILSA